MTSVSNVNTTTYSYETNAAQKTKEATKPNCVFDTTAATNNPQEKTTENKQTKLDKIVETLCIELQKYGITPEDIKKSGIIAKVTGMNEDQLINILNEKSEQDIKNLIECIKQGILDTVKDGKVDLEKAAKTGNDYLIAISTGWSIEGFKKHNKNVKKSSLMQRLIETNCLGKDATIENTSKEELATAVKEFFKILLGGKENPTSQEIKGQLQTYGRLLINSPDNEKAVFLEVSKHLYSENKCPAIKALFSSFMNQEAKHDVAKQAYQAEYLETMTTEEYGLTEEDSQELTSIIVKNVREEDMPECHQNYVKARDEWYNSNKNAIKEIQTKIAEAEKNGTELNLTPEEKEIILKYNNFVKGVSSGEFIGVADGNFSEDFKNKQLSTLNSDAYNLSEDTYKEILQATNEYIEKHSDDLNLKQEIVEKLIDNNTDGNYSKVAENFDTEIKAPAEKAIKQEEKAENNFGYTQQKRENIDAKNRRAEELKQQISPKETYTTFTLDKPISNNKEVSNKDLTVKEQVAQAKSFEEVIKIVGDSFKKIPNFKQALAQYVLSSSNSIILVNTLPYTTRPFLASKLIEKGKISVNDIDNLQLAISDKTILKNKFNDTNFA